MFKADADRAFRLPCQIAHQVVQRVGIGTGPGEGQDLGDALGKGGCAAQVAQADFDGEGVWGGEGGLGETGHVFFFFGQPETGFGRSDIDARPGRLFEGRLKSQLCGRAVWFTVVKAV